MQDSNHNTWRKISLQTFQELRARDEVIQELELRLTEESTRQFSSNDVTTLASIDAQSASNNDESLLQQQLEALRLILLTILH
jgi:hypothetical protein